MVRTKAWRLGAVLVALTLPVAGCGTITSFTSANAAHRSLADHVPFEGVATDLGAAGASLVGALLVPPLALLFPFVLADLALSAVAETAILPPLLVAKACRDPSGPEALSRGESIPVVAVPAQAILDPELESEK